MLLLTSNLSRGWTTRLSVVCFLLSTSSGAALLLALAAKIQLGLILALFAMFAGTTYLLLWTRIEPRARRAFKALTFAGIMAGIPATLAYDAWRFALVNVAGFRIKPFETFALFGYLISGRGISRSSAVWIGTAYHYLNGESFAVAYSFLFGGRDWRLAILWALVLEALMFTVYPGWLNLGAVMTEFTIVSLSGHIVYGTVLGLVVRERIAKGRSGISEAPRRTRTGHDTR